MKKLLLLAATFVASVGSMWADVSLPADNTPFTISNPEQAGCDGRGYLVSYNDALYLTDMKAAYAQYKKANYPDTYTAEGVGAEWAIYTSSKTSKTYLYNVQSGKFMGVGAKLGNTNYATSLVDEAKAVSFTDATYQGTAYVSIKTPDLQSNNTINFAPYWGKQSNAYGCWDGEKTAANSETRCLLTTTTSTVSSEIQAKVAAAVAAVESATPEQVAALQEQVNALCALVGTVGYPKTEATEAAALLAYKDSGVSAENYSDVQKAVADLKTCADVVMPEAGKTYQIKATYNTADKLTQYLGFNGTKLTLTDAIPEEGSVEFNVVSSTNGTVVLKIGEKFVQWTSGDNTTKSPNTNGVADEQSELANLTFVKATVGGPNANNLSADFLFGLFEIRGKGTANGQPYDFVCRNDKDGTGAFVAGNATDKYCDVSGGKYRTCYFQLAEVSKEEPEPENTTLSVSLFNGSDEIALSTESATNVATATGIKFTYENVSSDCFGYSCYINQEGAEDPLYIGGGEIGEGTDTDTFDAAINFVKGEQYQVVVSFILNGPSFTFNITGTYEEEEGPTGETVPTYTIKTPRGDLFTDGNGLLLTTRSLTLAGSRTETNDKWVIVPAKDNDHGVYIYNVEHKTFIGNNNRGTNGVTAPMVAEPNMFYRWATGSTNETVKNNAYNDLQYKETDYPWSLGEEDGLVGGKYYTINVCNWDDNQGNHTGLRLCSTSGYDDGNIFAITESGTMPKEDYDALLDLIFPTTPATPEAIAEAEALLALTGVGYPAETAEARTALAALVAQEEVNASDLAAAVSAYTTCTEITMPTAAKKYTVTAHFIDGTEANLAVVDGKLTLTRAEGAEAEVEAVSVEGSNVVLKTGEAYIHWTSGDATSKSADLDGLNEEFDEALNTLTLQAGGAEHFGQVLIQGAGTDDNRYYYIVRDNLDGTFSWVAQYPSDKFFDTNWNSNGQNRTSYFTFTEIEEQPTGDEFTFVNNGDGTVTITPANTTNYWYVNVVAQSDIESYGETESEQNGSAVYEAIAEFYSQTEGYQGEKSINVSELYKQVNGEDMTDGSYVITVAYLTETELFEGATMVVPDFDSTTARFDYTYGSTTGIANVASAMSSNAIFNLQGQRIVKLQKGINIVGGQKVIK